MDARGGERSRRANVIHRLHDEKNIRIVKKRKYEAHLYRRKISKIRRHADSFLSNERKRIMVRETRYLWIGNLPDRITEDRLIELFRR